MFAPTEEVKKWLDKPGLASAIPRLRQMPTMPEANRRVLSLLDDPDFSAEDVGIEIGRDVILTAQLFKIANSAMFALAEPLSSVVDAVTLIGALRLRALVSTAWAFQLLDEKKACAGFSPRNEWDHALLIAKKTQELAGEVGCRFAVKEAAFTAGLLHDLGKILLAVNTPEYFMAAREFAQTAELPLWQAELQILGYNHADLGACLLAMWGMAPEVVEAVGCHHQPELASSPEFSALTLVHMANCAVRGSPPAQECAEAFEQAARA